MIELVSTALIIGSFVVASVLGIILLVYYTKYLNLKSDNSTYVVLRDLDGRMKNVGKYVSMTMVKVTKETKKSELPTKKSEIVEDGNQVRKLEVTESKLAVKVIPHDSDDIQYWVIELGTRYNFSAISINYDNDDANRPREITILTDFDKSDLTRKVIHPLVDKSVLRVGLREGLNSIMSQASTLYQQIEFYKESVKKRDEMIHKLKVSTTSEELKAHLKSCLAVKEVIQEVRKVPIAAYSIVKGKIRSELSSNLKGMEAMVEDDIKRIDAAIASGEEKTGISEK